MSSVVRETGNRPPRPSCSHFRKDVQGLRGVAVILVVLFHSGLRVQGGFIGVDVFFVISGFVITSTLSREWDTYGTVRLRRFYKRRVKRLLPALSLMTAATVSASILLQSPNGPQQETAKTAIGTTAMVANFVLLRSVGNYFAPTADNNPLLHTWSLSVEEQFFLVFPAVLVAGWMFSRRHQITTWIPGGWLVFGGLAVPSGVLALVTSYGLVGIPLIGASPGLFAFYSSMTRAWEFAVGALVALYQFRLSRIPVRLLNYLAPVGGVMVVGSTLLLSERLTFPGLVVVVPVLGAALVIVSGLREQGEGRLLLTNSVLVWIGDLSYSWYLWHWPVLVFVRLHLSEHALVLGAASVLSLVPAYLSYRFVESPIRRSPRLDGRRFVGVLVLALILPATITAVLAFGSRAGWGLDWPVGAHIVVRNSCDHGPFDPSGCTWDVDNPRGVVLLAGDSQSWAVADGLVDAAADLGLSTTVAALNGCSFVAPSGQRGESDPTAACELFRGAVLNYAIETRPTLVAISNWSLSYGSADQTTNDLVSVIEPLNSLGVPIVIVRSYPAGDQEAMSKSLLFRPDSDRYTDAAGQVHGRSWFHDVEIELLERYDNLYFYDPYEVLCDGDSCWSAIGGVEYYTDSNHLSRAGSLLLAPSLADLMGSVVG